jgi:hypothetical protein
LIGFIDGRIINEKKMIYYMQFFLWTSDYFSKCRSADNSTGARSAGTSAAGLTAACPYFSVAGTSL